MGGVDILQQLIEDGELKGLPPLFSLFSLFFFLFFNPSLSTITKSIINYIYIYIYIFNYPRDG